MPELVDAPDLFEFSPSAIKLWRECQLAYSFSYIDGHRKGDTEATLKGTAIHTELEEWLRTKAVPTIPAAKRLLPLIPHPMHPRLWIEHAFRTLYPVGACRGFMDVAIPNPNTKYLPVPAGVSEPAFDPDVPIVMDHKSTKGLEYALTPTDLRTDPQAVLYGAALRLDVARERGTNRIEDVPEVDLVWNYTSKSKAEVRPVRLRQSLAILEDGLGVVLDDARAMAKVWSIEGGTAASLYAQKAVERDLRTCDKYGGCFHRERCPAYGKKSYSNSTETPVSSSTLARLRNNRIQNAASLKAEVDAELGPVNAPPAPGPIGYDPDPGVKAEPSRTVKPSPAPKSMPLIDTSGATAGSAVNPPDAAPNVSADDPPPASKPAKGKSKAKPTLDSIHESLIVLIKDRLDMGDYAGAKRAMEALCVLNPSVDPVVKFTD